MGEYQRRFVPGASRIIVAAGPAQTPVEWVLEGRAARTGIDPR
jgi:hypothetical protein